MYLPLHFYLTIAEVGRKGNGKTAVGRLQVLKRGKFQITKLHVSTTGLHTHMNCRSVETFILTNKSELFPIRQFSV